VSNDTVRSSMDEEVGRRMSRLQGRVCIVNGAASVIGQAVARVQANLVDQAGRRLVIDAASFLADIGAATAQMGYAAAKAAVVQLSRDLGVHLARDRIRVNAVLFGPIDTAALRAVFQRNHHRRRDGQPAVVGTPASRRYLALSGTALL
jgi:NAD(P)-dependent dehydrogenase (short-subunit alcohol dehydrogenase family)